MLDPQNLNPFAYWPHVALGVASVVLAIVALAAAKGSRVHRIAGVAFSVTMGVAASTALLFQFDRPGGAAAVSALTALYGIGTGALGVRPRAGALRALELASMLIAPGLALFCWGSLAMFGLQGIPPGREAEAYSMFAGVVVLALIYSAFVYGDVRYLRAKNVTPARLQRRHAVRMATAATEVVRAPLITFAPPLFGGATFPVYFFGPLLLIPLIYVTFVPRRLRQAPAIPVTS